MRNARRMAVKILPVVMIFVFLVIPIVHSARAYWAFENSSIFENFDGLLSIEQMNEKSVGLGTFFSRGMPFESYKAAVSLNWTEVTQTGTPSGLDFDIKSPYSYAEIQNFLLDLSKYENARLFRIGSSGQGRNIYSIQIGSGSKTILLTGGVHSRETAGPSFIIKQLADLLKESATDQSLGEMLEQYKVVAIPCINPDGWEHLYYNPTSRRKSNAAGVDLGRNMPTSNAEQLADGKRPIAMLSDYPSDEFYQGSYLGSETETRSAISWFTRYIPESIVYIDYHQSGNLIYGGKTYYEEKSRVRHSKDLANDVIRFMRNNNGVRWKYKKEEPELRRGEGSFTDFAIEVACGFTFSTEYGRLGMNSENGPVPLLFYKNMNENIEYFAPINKNLEVITLEIGPSASKGYTEKARSLQDGIYTKQSFDDLLMYLMERDMK